ncbi:MAG: alpha/beta fold hydrolase, partial [Armatimonadetes bacterium]|nr:alpha/beta fold hydrolase [Armatimonadota bacterium]
MYSPLSFLIAQPPRLGRSAPGLLLGLLLAGGAASLTVTQSLQASEATGVGSWDLRELRRVPRFEVAAPRTVVQDSREVLLSELYYAGEPWRGQRTRVFAYYARPAGAPGAAVPTRLPAMVLVHGGGGTAFAEWARLWAARGYAALAMDLAGRGPERQPLPDGGPDQTEEWKFRRLRDGVRDSWPYQSVAAVIRAVSVLRNLPEVDRDRIGITGISWGGYLTSLVMSLDDRLRVAVPVYGCGFLDENSTWLPVFASLPEGERKLWVENFDPSRYLRRCQIPVLWVNGTNDFAYPLDSYRKSYRLPTGSRTLCVTVKMPHGHQ